VAAVDSSTPAIGPLTLLTCLKNRINIVESVGCVCGKIDEKKRKVGQLGWVGGLSRAWSDNHLVCYDWKSKERRKKVFLTIIKINKKAWWCLWLVGGLGWLLCLDGQVARKEEYKPLYKVLLVLWKGLVGPLKACGQKVGHTSQQGLGQCAWQFWVCMWLFGFVCHNVFNFHKGEKKWVIGKVIYWAFWIQSQLKTKTPDSSLSPWP